MFTPLPTPREMAAWDKAAMTEWGFHPYVLMENASREAWSVLAGELGDPRGKRLVCLAGPGNNGGDAIALARHAKEGGMDVLLVLTRPRSRYAGPAGYNLRLTAKIGLPIIQASRFDPVRDGPFDAVADGLLGTGFAGTLRPNMAALVETVNALGKTALVLALDIPSGLSGLTGKPCPAAVKAGVTVAFEAAKTGTVLPEAAPYVGRLIVRGIGIPAAVKARYPAQAVLLDDGVFASLPGPDPLLHKGKAGRILILGGSPGLTGAPFLSAMAALRCGGGLITIACPKGIEDRVKNGCPDVMTLPLGEGEDWTGDMAGELSDVLSGTNALVIGPGLGRKPGTGAFLRALPPLVAPRVLDADALYFLARDPELIRLAGPLAVLTPHPGEMAALLGLSIDEIQADRFGAAGALAGKTGGTAILKGPGTVIAPNPEEPRPVSLSPFACANLAVGGSGDVLSGVMAALLAAGNSPLQAARLGVYWHGLAGMRLAGLFPGRGNLASEIAGALPFVIKERMHA